MMKEWKDFSGRLTVWLSDDDKDFGPFARKMVSRFGEPTERLDGLDQRYWDFNAGGFTVVLHTDAMAGVSIQIKDGPHEKELRSIGEWLIKNHQTQNTSLQPTRNPRG